MAVMRLPTSFLSRGKLFLQTLPLPPHGSIHLQRFSAEVNHSPQTFICNPNRARRLRRAASFSMMQLPRTTARSRENVKKLGFVFGVISRQSGKTAEFGREWTQPGIAQRQIFWSGGCKNSEIAGVFDTGKYYNWESSYKVSFLLMTWFNIHWRSSELLGWKSRRTEEEKNSKSKKKQVT